MNETNQKKSEVVASCETMNVRADFCVLLIILGRSVACVEGNLCYLFVL